MVWIGSHRDDIARFERAPNAERAVWQGFKNYLIDYRRRETASWGSTFCPAPGRTGSGEMTQEETLVFLGAPVDWGHGDEAEFPENGDLDEYRYRCFLNALAKLDDETRGILCDVFIEGLSYSECARRRGLHVTSVGKLLNRHLQAIAADAGLKVREHQEYAPHASLRASREGFGGRA